MLIYTTNQKFWSQFCHFSNLYNSINFYRIEMIFEISLKNWNWVKNEFKYVRILIKKKVVFLKSITNNIIANAENCVSSDNTGQIFVDIVRTASEIRSSATSYYYIQLYLFLLFYTLCNECVVSYAQKYTKHLQKRNVALIVSCIDHHMQTY